MNIDYIIWTKLDHLTELSHLNNVWCLKKYQPKIIRTKANSGSSLLDVSDLAELKVAEFPKLALIHGIPLSLLI